ARVHVISNHANLGLATGLNIGVQWAIEKRFAWVLLLDQDTMPHPDMLQQFRQTFVESLHPETIALIGARFAAASPDRYRPEDAITSGSLVSLAAIAVAGRFREDFFIDFIDIDFNLRVRALGLDIVIVPQVIMDHRIGNPSRHRVLRKERI